MPKRKIAVLGAGKAAAALGIALQKAGYTIGGVLSRRAASSAQLARQLKCPAFMECGELARAAEVVIIAVTDRQIAAAAEQLAATGRCAQKVFFHVCGSQSAESLHCLREAGAFIGSMHPLQSFADAKSGWKMLKGIYFAVDGDAQAVSIAREMIAALDAQTLDIPSSQRAIYHAAACTASNYLAAIVHNAAQMLAALGIEEQAAARALAPLLQGTLDNIREKGALHSLTGPIVRGDAATVAAHMRALAALPPEEAALYRVLGQYALGMAERRQSVDDEQIKMLRRVLG